MARQTEHQKAHITGRHRYGERESHAGKSKPSKTRVYKASTAISPPKNYRERTKKSVVVKPISKDDVQKLQHISKHARSSRISKHLQVPEPCLEPCGLSSAFHGKNLPMIIRALYFETDLKNRISRRSKIPYPEHRKSSFQWSPCSSCPKIYRSKSKRSCLSRKCFAKCTSYQRATNQWKNWDYCAAEN